MMSYEVPTMESILREASVEDVCLHNGRLHYIYNNCLVEHDVSTLTYTVEHRIRRMKSGGQNPPKVPESDIHIFCGMLIDAVDAGYYPWSVRVVERIVVGEVRDGDRVIEGYHRKSRLYIVKPVVGHVDDDGDLIEVRNR
ncbi:hypothetical protein [Phytoactinopolyspora mesophila]|uniref:Uncharacterized protein n=1 Tax=Phytoactinopolyspora mesophila TaxID=2650750 RepID=A0A7K3M6T7_9ACTN|nr:hypothetical protein [Phytoactinopolyspora mesophila]NDL58612.1 hypothetical protein [Phytoactinopolyspora mesophila]